MSLPPGSRVGIYQVVEMIGVGGMGEVYRATDSRLDRPVAIKTLPEEFSADPDRLARFEREAKVLAQLNHPHIASIYGIEPGPPVALAMEMADGETLAHRIASGPIAFDDAIVVGRQIAEGLEHAHAKGIVHRDLKPANIKIGFRDGDAHVKILDFGLAKAMSNDSSVSAISAVSSPTITSPANLTRAGVVLGTAAYMAPEQARGRHIDHRADIWAFGCVLFEMIAGRRPFEGDEVADVMAKVIQSEPQWTLLPAATPPALRTLLRRCLQKDPHRRLHSIADARIDLEDLAGGDPTIDVRSAAPPRRARAWLPAVAGLALGAIVTAFGLAWMSPQAPPAKAPAVTRFTVAAPDGWTFGRNQNTARLNFALSPDGETLASTMVAKDGSRKIFIRRMSDLAFREVPGTEDASFLFWSPDSLRIGFGTSTGIRVADVAGGGSRVLATDPALASASWSNSDAIIAQGGAGRPLIVWQANSTDLKPLGDLPSSVQARVSPRWLPRGNRAIFLDGMGNGSWMVRAIDSSATTTEVTALESSGAGSVGLEYQTGHLLLCATETSGRTVVTAQPADPDTLQLSGAPFVLATDVNCAFSASTNGHIVFGENRTALSRFVWLNDRGAEVADLGKALNRGINFDLSHDERFLAVQQPDVLLLHDLVRGATSPLSVRGTDPTWSPDDREIAYTVASGTDAGIYAVPVFGGTPRRLFKSDVPTYIEDWSMDGQWISAVARGEGMLISLKGGTLTQLGVSGSGVTSDELQFSPDSRWLTYGVTRPSGSEVFLATVPLSGQRWQVSVGGGASPRWSEDGRSVYYLAMSGALMRVDLDLGAAVPQIGPPRRIIDAVSATVPTLDQVALSRTGRFLVRRDVFSASNQTELLQVIVNWPSLLRTPASATR